MLQLVTVNAMTAAKQAAQTLVRIGIGTQLAAPRRNAICNAEPIEGGQSVLY